MDLVPAEFCPACYVRYNRQLWPSSCVCTGAVFSFLQMPTTLMTLELSNDTERTAIKLDPSQQAAVTIMEEGRNVFLTGNAGTGKSTVITQFIAGSKRTIDMTATTGIAALNLRDQIFEKCGLKLNANTIYRWSGIGLGPLEHENDDQCFSRLCEEMKKPPLSITREKAFDRIFYAKCLIIDEISMLPGKTFQFLEYLCRKLRKNDLPWGGLQVICVGDFCSSPGIEDRQIRLGVPKFSMAAVKL